MLYSFDTIEERDVDFVVMRSFCELPDFVALFLQKTKWGGAKIVNVEHSYFDVVLGESDITVIISFDNKQYALLIENKIDAPAMSEQNARYYKRGDEGKRTGKYEDYSVFLIAPQTYLDTNEEARKYKNQISYEKMLAVFERNGKAFESAIIKKAIEKKSKGYTLKEAPNVTRFWKDLEEHCKEMNEGIVMYPVKTPKGAWSMWPQFKTELKGATLYYKADQGVVALQFGKELCSNEVLLACCEQLRDSDMHWKRTGKSRSIQIDVDKMDFQRPFETYHKEISVMLDAVKRLTELALKLNDKGYGW